MSITEDGGAQVWIPATFVVLAGWFLFDSGTAVPEIARTESFDRALIEPGPRRSATLTDPPTMEIAGYQQRCTECHDMFESPPETDRELLQHVDIKLDHGLNSRCFNCHSLEHRDKLALQGTEEVGFERAVELCAKCHGPTFRDWERGVHGRTTGSWIGPEAGQRRLRCIECHDPHSPAFPSYAPLPGPNTLRMSPPPPASAHETPDEARTSPLLRWLKPASGDEHQPHGDNTEEEH